jgi:EAL domain-containing protein (putative c-di-GMP-specific phosphodiesterase class I)
VRHPRTEIYLDDFGTGYSSLSYLLDFPFDVVKIDRSFIHNLEQDDRRADVVRMIIQLAANLKKAVIAEGVETPGELARLQDLGCGLVQGFLLSRPLAPDIMSQLLMMSPNLFERDPRRAGIPTVLTSNGGLRAPAGQLVSPSKVK